MPTFISVNRQRIAQNARKGTHLPPVRYSSSKSGKASYCSELAILDASGNRVARIVYDPHTPILKCGARLVIEADYNVEVLS